ncbi:MAG: hypothetical protein HY671_04190 [Chloroflexi bacterium]|nr:hypothetical protein [Chloroflexota bacterium]
MPAWVYGVPCGLTNERLVSEQLGRLRYGEMAPFILRSGMLFAFQDLNAVGNPFAALVPGRSAERFDLVEWAGDPDRSRWLADLMNRSLNKLTGRLGLSLDREHHRYYFPMLKEGQEREVQYRPLNQKTASRRVVWRRRNKRTGELRRNWYHRALALSFLRIGRVDWVLCMRPELRVTRDGITPIASRKVGGQVTREKSRRFNADLLAEVNFWRDYLRDGRSKIILPFGPGQGMVISTEILTGLIDWPGIPKEYAVPFKNVNYIDDLFTWAELNQMDAVVDDDVGVDDLNDAEELEDDDTDK